MIFQCTALHCVSRTEVPSSIVRPSFTFPLPLVSQCSPSGLGSDSRQRICVWPGLWQYLLPTDEHCEVKSIWYEDPISESACLSGAVKMVCFSLSSKLKLSFYVKWLMLLISLNWCGTQVDCYCSCMHTAGHVAVNPVVIERKGVGWVAASSSPSEHQLSSLPNRNLRPVGKG